MKCGIEIFVTLEGEVRGVAGTEYPVRPDMSAIYNDFVASGSSEDYEEEEVPD